MVPFSPCSHLGAADVAAFLHALRWWNARVMRVHAQDLIKCCMGADWSVIYVYLKCFYYGLESRARMVFHIFNVCRQGDGARNHFYSEQIVMAVAVLPPRLSLFLPSFLFFSPTQLLPTIFEHETEKSLLRRCGSWSRHRPPVSVCEIKSHFIGKIFRWTFRPAFMSKTTNRTARKKETELQVLAPSSKRPPNYKPRITRYENAYILLRQRLRLHYLYFPEKFERKKISFHHFRLCHRYLLARSAPLRFASYFINKIKIVILNN